MERKEATADVHPVFKARLTPGQRLADKMVAFCGSWTFIIIVCAIIILWITANILMIVNKWDPYPFILLNLALSCLAAIEAPIILMSQYREMQRDRIHAKYDYEINKKAEKEIRELKKAVERLEKKL
ncbi:MAG: DUF1003 domain-containing protein [Candidatus Paceibacterota bacterium]